MIANRNSEVEVSAWKRKMVVGLALAIVFIVVLLSVLTILSSDGRPLLIPSSGTLDLVQDQPDVVVTTEINRLSWGAVIAGAVIAIILQLSFNLLGISIGVASLTPEYGEDPVEPKSLATGAMLWMGVSTLVALFIGGWIAARFAGLPDDVDGMLHGLMVWGVVTLVSLILITTGIGRIISGITSLIGHGLNLAGQVTQGVASLAQGAVQGAANVAGSAIEGAVNVAQGAADTFADAVEKAVDSSPEVAEALNLQNLSLDTIVDEARRLLQQAGIAPSQVEATAQSAMQEVRDAAQQVIQNPGEADQTIDLAVRRVFRLGQAIAEEADRDALIRLMMERGNMAEGQAREMLARWEDTFAKAKRDVEQAREQATRKAQELQVEIEHKAKEAKREAERIAREAAQATTRTISTLAAAVFAAILIGAIAAGVGGLLGAPETLTTAQIETTTSSPLDAF
jgi:hypothetical protein